MEIILIGYMGAGKTTVGKLLSQRSNSSFVDIDEAIVTEQGRTIAEIFAEVGETGFRQIEADTIAHALMSTGVVSTGGGCVVTERNRRLLKSHPYVVYLKADFETVWERIMNNLTVERPLANPNEMASSKERYRDRLDWYEECASHVIETDNITPEQVVEAILKIEQFQQQL